MKRKLIILSFLLLNLLIVNAAEPVRFSASGPGTVAANQPFQIVFSINTTAGRDLRVPEITAFEVLAGPFTSTSSSIQIINGRQSSSEEVSYTYTLQARKTGTYTIPPASVNVNGQKYVSNGLSIKVLPADAAAKQSNQGSVRGGQGGGRQAAKASISNDDLFIRTQVSKTNVYEQEALLVTYKLYSLVDVVHCGAKKMPDFSGFMKQDLEQKQQTQMTLERFNGRNYQAAVLYQVVLYPQHSGVIEIPKADFETVVRIQNRQPVRSIFDDFFDTYSDVNKVLTSSAVKINVSALPANKPASYSGIVGHFNVNANISSTHVKNNDAITLKLVISGSGNLKMINAPLLKFPNGIEKFDPKITSNFKTTTNGVVGSKVIEYMFIPRHSGKYEIPPVEFSYFDTEKKTYRVVATPVYKIQVDKGEGAEGPMIVNNYSDKEDVKQIARDIRFIATNDFEISTEKEPLFGSFLSWIMFIIPLIIAAILFVLFSHKAKENADLLLVKNKKANKLAQKRLKLAQKYLKEGKKDQFYEEVMKATWTYLSDKLSIPVASLTKDEVISELTQAGIEPELISKVMEILNTCEFARYAPNSGQQAMGNLYDETIQVISNLEEKYKRK